MRRASACSVHDLPIALEMQQFWEISLNTAVQEPRYAGLNLATTEDNLVAGRDRDY